MVGLEIGSEPGLASGSGLVYGFTSKALVEIIVVEVTALHFPPSSIVNLTQKKQKTLLKFNSKEQKIVI